MFVSKLLMLGLAIFLVKELGVDLFGKWGVIRSTSSVFTILLGFGIGVSAVRFISEYHKTKINIVGGVIVLGLLFSLIFGVLLTLVYNLSSEWIATYFLDDTSIVQELKVSSYFLFFIALNGMLSGIISGFKKFKYNAIVNAIASAIAVPIIFYLSRELNLKGVVYGYLSYYFLLFFGYLICCRILLKRHLIRIHFKDYKGAVPILFSHNIPAILSGGIGGVAVWFVSAYVARLENGYKIIGINNAAKIIQNSVMEIAAQIDLPILTFITSTKGKISEKINQFTPLVLISILVLPLIWTPELISALFNKNQFVGERFLLIISLTMLTTYIMIYKRGMGRSIISNDLVWWGFYENILWSLMLLCFIYFFVPLYGSLGYAISFSLAYAIDLIIILPFYLKKNLISKQLVVSMEMLVSWGIVLMGVIAVYWNLGLTIRVLSLVLVLPLQYVILKRINEKI